MPPIDEVTDAVELKARKLAELISKYTYEDPALLTKARERSTESSLSKMKTQKEWEASFNPLTSNPYEESSPGSGVFPNYGKFKTAPPTKSMEVDPITRSQIQLFVPNEEEQLATLAKQTGIGVTTQGNDVMGIDPVTKELLAFDPAGISKMPDDARRSRSSLLDSLSLRLSGSSPTLSRGVQGINNAIEGIQTGTDNLSNDPRFPVSSKIASALKWLSPSINTLDEAGIEALSNIDLPVEALGKDPKSAALVGTGLAATRQLGKTALFPDTTTPSLAEAGIDVASNVAGERASAFLPTMFNKGAGVVKKGYQKATGKLPAVAKHADELMVKAAPSLLNPEEIAAYRAGNLASMVEGATSESDALYKIGKERFGGQAYKFAQAWYNKPEAIARELNLPEDAWKYETTKSKDGEAVFRNVLDDIQWLQENAPAEFAPVIQGKSIQDRFKEAATKIQELGGSIGGYYESKAAEGTRINIKDILSSESYQHINELINKETSVKVRKALVKSKEDFLLGMLENVETSNPDLSKVLVEGYREGKYSLDKLEKFMTREGMGMDIPIDRAFDMKKQNDVLALWQKENNKIKTSQVLQRDKANALREVLDNMLTTDASTGDATAQELLRQNKTYHYLIDIVGALNDAQARAGKDGFKLSNYVAGFLNSPWRFAVLTGQKLTRNPDVVSKVRGALSASNVDGLTQQSASWMQRKASGGLQAMQDMVKYLGGAAKTGYTNTISPSRQIALSESARGLLEKDMVERVPTTNIPRDPELISASSEHQAAIMQELPEEVRPLFVAAMKGNNPSTKEAVLAQVIEIAPQMFEPGVNGIMSSVKRGDHFVIGNPMEAKMYKDSMTMMYRSGKISPEFLAAQLSALNDVNDGRILPLPTSDNPATAQSNTPNAAEEQDLSPLAKLAASIKK